MTSLCRPLSSSIISSSSLLLSSSSSSSSLSHSFSFPSSSPSSSSSSSSSLFTLPVRGVRNHIPRGRATITVKLLTDFPSLGLKDDLVKVRRGYHRNYLLPRGIAGYHVVDRFDKYRSKGKVEQETKVSTDASVGGVVSIVNNRRFVDAIKNRAGTKFTINFYRPPVLNSVENACFPVYFHSIHRKLIQQFGWQTLLPEQIQFPSQPISTEGTTIHQQFALTTFGDHSITVNFSADTSPLTIKVKISVVGRGKAKEEKKKEDDDEDGEDNEEGTNDEKRKG